MGEAEKGKNNRNNILPVGLRKHVQSDAQFGRNKKNINGGSGEIERWANEKNHGPTKIVTGWIFNRQRVIY
jgi:hypothetical protein